MEIFKPMIAVGSIPQFDDYLRRCLFEIRSRSLIQTVNMLVYLTTIRDCLAMCSSIIFYWLYLNTGSKVKFEI